MAPIRAASPACAALLLATGLLCQGGMSWRAAPGGNAPPGRDQHALFFEPAQSRFILFGGVAWPTMLADSWSWDTAGGWQQLQPATSPPGGAVHASFTRGGEQFVFSSADLNALWKWTGTDWQRVPTTGQTPPNQSYVGTAYDGDRDVLVTVRLGGGGVVRTYELQGTVWQDRTAGYVQPPPAEWAAMAWLPGRGILLHGGIDFVSIPSPQFPVSTWLWDGAGWSQLAASGPNGFHRHLMTWYPARQRMVMYTTARELYEWQSGSNTWLQVAGPHTVDHVWVPMAYDPLADRMLSFGTGYFTQPSAANFEFLESVSPARATRYGTACSGSAGLPVLAAAPDQRPWIGDGAFQIDLGPVPSGAGLFFTLGVSDRHWAGMPAPVALGLLGLPGCFALHSAEIVEFALADPTGSGRIVLRYTPLPALFGLRFFAQAVIHDPLAGNPAGGVTSNAVRCEFGVR